MPAGRRMQLGNYEPLLQLATGGMAAVYVAWQIGAAGFERLVVVKRVHPHLLSNREFYDMFRDEARVAAMLHHPNVVPVTDVVEADGELFLVMEYVDSVALSTLLKAAHDLGARLAPQAVARVLADSLAGLHAAHEALDMRGQRLEIVHRDFSPQNVVVGADGSSRLIDFGVAKARHRLTETRSGSLKGKYGYMSPEQAKAQPVDRRADLFSAGVVLWESLAGARLFRGENELDTIRRIAEAPIPAPSSIAPAVPRELDAVVQRALARDREERFQSAHEFVEALEAACPPAPAREMAAIVKAYCGDRLDARRETLQGMLEGRIEPLAESRIPLGSGGDEAVTSASSPSSRRRLLQGAPDEGTDGKIAATHDAPSPRRRSVTRLWMGVAAIAALAATVGGVALWSRSRASTPSPVAGSARASAAASPASSSDVAADEVSLQLAADAAIERISAPGIHSAQVDGPRARLVVARWGGDLPIDAVLAGGRFAHAVATSDGPRELKLLGAAEATPEAPSPSSASGATEPPPTASPAPAPRSGAVPRKARPSGAAPLQTELHQNPY
jgi:serine/threonine-protein kinase